MQLFRSEEATQLEAQHKHRDCSKSSSLHFNIPLILLLLLYRIINYSLCLIQATNIANHEDSSADCVPGITKNVRCSHRKYIRLDLIFNRVSGNSGLGERPIVPKLVSGAIFAFGVPIKPQRASVHYGADTYNGSGVSVTCTGSLCLTPWDSRARYLSKMEMHLDLTRWFATLVGTGAVDYQGLTRDLGQ